MPDLPFSSRADHVESLLRVKESFDVIARKILVGGRDAVLFFIDGFVKDEVMEKILEYIMSLKAEEVKDISGAEVFAGRFITYVEVDTEQDPQAVLVPVLSGQLALLVDGVDGFILIDARTYPARGVEEPDSKIPSGEHSEIIHDHQGKIEVHKFFAVRETASGDLADLSEPVEQRILMDVQVLRDEGRLSRMDQILTQCCDQFGLPLLVIEIEFHQSGMDQEADFGIFFFKCLQHPVDIIVAVITDRVRNIEPVGDADGIHSLTVKTGGIFEILEKVADPGF